MNVYNLNDLVSSTVQTAITGLTATHLMTSLGSGFQYALTGYSLVNSINASGFMDILGSSDYPPLYRINLPANCLEAAEDLSEAPVPLGDNQNVRLIAGTNLNVTGTFRFSKEKV